MTVKIALHSSLWVGDPAAPTWTPISAPLQITHMSAWAQKSPLEIYADFDVALLAVGRAVQRHIRVWTEGRHYWVTSRVDPIRIKRQRREQRQRAKYGTR